ncbi:hypothetical protein [Novosphingobium sp. Chol11]|uniref:NAD(P)/FAD-dependent oxidoreductase n=1 Tax=Novosphingobium sp. Chol11 TaxID=1385763 RepID=UPI0025EBE444|nr:hypothetical protein [Novosphingobium sp. Chol11]
MTAARRSSVHLAGHGVGIAAAQAVLTENGIGFSAAPGPERGAAPMVMLGEQALHLLDGLFGAGCVAGSHRITRRSVLWNEPEPVAIPHQAVAMPGHELLSALPLAEGVLPIETPQFTLHARPPELGIRQFGQREAAVAPVVLAASADPSAVLVEAVAAGWLFMIPLGGPDGWLLAVGDALDALLDQSRLIAPAIGAVGAVAARFETAPRVLEHLVGDDWLGVGSGALALDPLCGDGTATAARGGILAGAVASAIAEGEAPAPFLRHYRAMCIAALRRHLAACLPFYQRGGSGPWWQEQAEATAAGYAWCTGMLASEPEPAFVLTGSRLAKRTVAA